MVASRFGKYRARARAGQLWAALALAGCAGAPAGPSAPAPDLSMLRGCWIERRGGETLTMRWFPDGAFWRGEWMRYPAGGAPPETARYRIAETPRGWQVCGVREDRCWPLDVTLPTMAEDPPERMTVWASETALEMRVHAPDGETDLFRGQRDGCD